MKFCLSYVLHDNNIETINIGLLVAHKLVLSCYSSQWLMLDIVTYKEVMNCVSCDTSYVDIQL